MFLQVVLALAIFMSHAQTLNYLFYKLTLRVEFFTRCFKVCILATCFKMNCKIHGGRGGGGVNQA